MLNIFLLCINYLKIIFHYINIYFFFNLFTVSLNSTILNENIDENIIDHTDIEEENVNEKKNIKNYLNQLHTENNELNELIENLVSNLDLKDTTINKKITVKINSLLENKKFKIGLLTNEIPPIVYGGVATWIVNFIKMFESSDIFEVVPIFLESYLNDTLPDDIAIKYPNIRIIRFGDNINNYFEDIDICVNNLWICTDILKHIKYEFPNLTLITVCHSLIIMENLTNLGSVYTNNFDQQEATFEVSDIVVLISKAEEKYYHKYNYDKINPKTYVIYNCYSPKYDDKILDINYWSSIIGFIGRHVPRKRPQLLIEAVVDLKLDNISVHNFGVDTDRYHNNYWYNLKHKFKNSLKITNFTSDKTIIENYWKTIGCNSILGIYEPFGYTICEALDRRMPLIVSNIDGPKEIIENVKDNVTLYEVNYNYEKDKANFKHALLKYLELTPEEKKIRAFKARKCLDRFRPERIIIDWNILFFKIINKEI